MSRMDSDLCHDGWNHYNEVWTHVQVCGAETAVLF